MRIFGFEIRRVRPEPDQLQDFITLLELATKQWAACRKAGEAVRPWIDWETKEIFVAEYNKPSKAAK